MPMSFFQFWKKPETKTKLPISDIPLFSALGPNELELIESKMRRVEYKKGDIVYRIGEKPEAFYIILLGRFRVVSVRGETISILSQGEYFGESSILLGRDHSATIETKNDGLVLRIDKKDFQNLISEIPSLSLHLSRTLGHRLTAGMSRSEISKTKIISICDHQMDAEKRKFCWSLSAMLGQKNKKTILIGIEDKTEKRFEDIVNKKLSFSNFTGSGFDEIKKLIHDPNSSFHFLRVGNGVSGPDAESGIVVLIGYLIERYEFILIDLPEEPSDISTKALQQSDLIYFLARESDRKTQKTISYLNGFRTSFGFTTDEIRFILCEDSNSKSAEASSFVPKEKNMHRVFNILPLGQELLNLSSQQTAQFVLDHPDHRYTRVIRFLSRELRGKLVGLALGSGAAFGFAHIGVLRVLEREKIPIDIIAGSSIGALIGGFWASGLNSKALEEIALSLDSKSVFFKLIGFRDFLLPHNGFFKGNQVSRFLRNYLERKTFRMLNIPVKIAATNLFTGEEVVCDEGDVVDAIRASISIPGIFRPMKWGKEYFLIDGGVADPLPVKLLNQYGVKKIIAVNVLSASEDHIRRKEYFEAKKMELEANLKRKNLLIRGWISLCNMIIQRYRDNVFNVLMNTIQFLEYGVAETAGAGADIVIHPVVLDAHWAEFHSVSKFIKCGETAAMEQLSEIKRLVEETT